ncbi:MAG TPA: substrate-binding domain-containing protein [Dermatophilaceae bacterium]|nr:substrate-binding domain-containing protein [Dermatophilaceae bacterium]
MAASAAVATVAGGAFGAAWRLGSGEQCDGAGTQLTVAVTPDLAPALSQAARLMRAQHQKGDCVQVVVRAQSPASVAAALAARAQVPDVWVPDSAVWLERAHVPRTTPRRSVARSPVVVAFPAAAAPNRATTPPSLSMLFATASIEPPRLHLPDLTTSAPAAIGFWAVQSALGGERTARSRLTVLLRTVTVAGSTPSDALAQTARDARGMVPVSEQAVWTFNGFVPATSRMTAAYGAPSAVLDYPMTVLTREPAKVQAAARLRDLMTGRTGAGLLWAVGFRTAAGAAADTPASTRGQRLPDRPASAPVVPAAVERAVRTATLLRLGSRMLAVIDVSERFGTPRPQLGGRSGLDLAKGAAVEGLNLLPDDSEVGVWAFSRAGAGRADHVQVAPMAPLNQLSQRGNHRQAVAAAINSLTAAHHGRSGLYDTLLAAVRTMRASWKAAMVNSVVVLSDGIDDDDGIGIGTLISKLVRLQDPKRPVPVISILLGKGGDIQGLKAVGAVTGGATYRATTASQLASVFLDAIGQRACRPTC